MRMKKRTKAKGFWKITMWGLLAAALATEYSKPPEERTGTGLVGGLVPYDLRPPSLERLRDAVWNPEDPRILMPHPFGVGWAPNVGRLWSLWKAREEPQIDYAPEPLD